MSNVIFNLHHPGVRFGNRLCSYVFARGYCEHYGFELHTDAWAGERLFCIDHPRCSGDLPRKDENTLVPGEGNISYLSYSQRQKCADYYTLTQIKQWLRFRPNVEAALQALVPPDDLALAHLRRGDFAGYGFPLVSRESYVRAARDAGVSESKLCFVSEEEPALHPHFTGELDFAPDFFRMAKASTLFRANSTFSFWAAAIAQANQRARVFSPVIEGLVGGIEHECAFIAGNGARMADFDFVEPLTIPDN